MNKKFSIIVIFLGLFFLLFSMGNINATDSNDVYKKTKKMANKARDFARKGNIEESLNIYLKISDIYEKLLKESPKNNNYKNDYEHYLNQTGQVQLKYAKEMAKSKKYDISAKYYSLAVKAFEAALKRLPNNKRFLQNIEYCLYYGGISGFTYALENHESAPDFSIEAISGEKIKLKDFKGNPVILKFWTAWCPESRKNMITMKALYKKYSSKGLKIICISFDKLKNWKKSGSDKRAEEITKTLPFESGWGTKEIYYNYGVIRSVPTLVLLDKNLKVVKVIPSKDRTVEKLSLEIEKLL